MVNNHQPYIYIYPDWIRNWTFGAIRIRINKKELVQLVTALQISWGEYVCLKKWLSRFMGFLFCEWRYALTRDLRCHLNESLWKILIICLLICLHSLSERSWIRSHQRRVAALRCMKTCGFRDHGTVRQFVKASLCTSLIMSTPD